MSRRSDVTEIKSGKRWNCEYWNTNKQRNIVLVIKELIGFLPWVCSHWLLETWYRDNAASNKSNCWNCGIYPGGLVQFSLWFASKKAVWENKANQIKVWKMISISPLLTFSLWDYLGVKAKPRRKNTINLLPFLRDLALVRHLTSMTISIVNFQQLGLVSF